MTQYEDFKEYIERNYLDMIMAEMEVYINDRKDDFWYDQVSWMYCDGVFVL